MSDTAPLTSGKAPPAPLIGLAFGLFVFLTCELFPIGAQAELAAGLGAPPDRSGCW